MADVSDVLELREVTIAATITPNTTTDRPFRARIDRALYELHLPREQVNRASVLGRRTRHSLQRDMDLRQAVRERRTDHLVDSGIL